MIRNRRQLAKPKLTVDVYGLGKKRRRQREQKLKSTAADNSCLIRVNSTTHLRKELNSKVEVGEGSEDEDLIQGLNQCLETPLNDTYVAFIHLSNGFPKLMFHNRLPPVVLKHHLYSVLDDASFVQQQLNDLCKDGILVCFKLNTGPEDWIIAKTTDYISLIRDIGSSVLETINKFVHKILPLCESYISVDELTRLGITDPDTTTLVRCGVLLLQEARVYRVGVPGIGPYIREIIMGRDEVKNILKKAKHREMLRVTLLKKKFKKCRMSMEFILMDMVEAELVDAVDIAMGPLIRFNE